MPQNTDDGSIAQDAGLLRRIHPTQVVQDENIGGPRPSSAAFRDLELSVDAEPALEAAGLDWHFSLKDHPSYSLVRFRASVPRERGLSVVPDPQPENSAHSLVIGKKPQSTVNYIRDRAEWVYLADPVPDE